MTENMSYEEAREALIEVVTTLEQGGTSLASHCNSGNAARSSRRSASPLLRVLGSDSTRRWEPTKGASRSARPRTRGR